MYHPVKRLLDIFGALTGMLGLVALLPFLALAIRLNSSGPVFFVQTRVGKNGRKFRFIKLRTMSVDSDLPDTMLDLINETGGITFKSARDPRVTRVGRWLRNLSLDELPQFINVLRGDMSLVGPRPPLVSEVERYSETQMLRLSVPQGMTGLWQVLGRSLLKFEEMVDLDLYYIKNASLTLDLWILALTIPAVLLRRGAM